EHDAQARGGARAVVPHEEAVAVHGDRAASACTHPVGDRAEAREPDAGTAGLARDEAEVSLAAVRIARAEDARMDDAHVEPARLADEGELLAGRGAECPGAGALEERLDAVGRAHGQLEAAARVRPVADGRPERDIQPHARA